MFANAVRNPFANLVGYSTTSIKAATYYMVAAQFKGTGDGQDEVCINDLVKMTGVTPGAYRTADSDGSPCIMIPDGTGFYTSYYYISDARNPDKTTTTAWAAGRNVVTDKIKLGQAFWFIAPIAEDGATATFAGEVKDLTTVGSIAITDTNYKMVANPFPIPLTWEMLTTTGFTPGAYRTADTDGAPVIMVPDGTGFYTSYYYISDARNPDKTSTTAWASGRNVATGVLAPVGQGFWLQSASNGSITIDINKK